MILKWEDQNNEIEKKRYISRYGGLWLSFKQADENIQKRDFQLSEKGKGQSVLELTNNLEKVMEQIQKDKESRLKLSNANDAKDLYTI